MFVRCLWIGLRHGCEVPTQGTLHIHCQLQWPQRRVFGHCFRHQPLRSWTQVRVREGVRSVRRLSGTLPRVYVREKVLSKNRLVGTLLWVRVREKVLSKATRRSSTLPPRSAAPKASPTTLLRYFAPGLSTGKAAL